MLKEASLLFEYQNGVKKELNLTAAQTAIIIKILGIEQKNDGTFCAYTTDSLKEIVKMDDNPLRMEF